MSQRHDRLRLVCLSTMDWAGSCCEQHDATSQPTPRGTCTTPSQQYQPTAHLETTGRRRTDAGQIKFKTRNINMRKGKQVGQTKPCLKGKSKIRAEQIREMSRSLPIREAESQNSNQLCGNCGRRDHNRNRQAFDSR